jgi:phosphoenolpyruvate carboxykinase (ATP)
MLGERIERYQVPVWLVNTGWTGGPYGKGSRMKIQATRAMVAAALSGGLDRVRFERDPIFNVDVPTSCPGVAPGVLTPRGTWPNQAEYDAQAAKLARMFVENFAAFQPHVAAEVKAAGPRG